MEQLELKPTILHEQTDDGKTIIEKFEHNADVGFAIALLTPDDMGHSKKDGDGNKKSRARQNVVFEMGYFVGRLGRQRVCALTKGDVEIPSDYQGVIYTPLDNHDGWKMKLAKELKSAGYTVDLNKAM